MKDQTVGVVVITFNRLDFLKEIIGAIKNQTRKPDEIIVVNNSSTDGTGEWLKEQEGLTVVTQDNVGSSGGQYTGIKTAYENGHYWIWTMDDDVVPAQDCLEQLLRFPDTNLIRTPLRYRPDGEMFINDALHYNMSNPFSSIWIDIISKKDMDKELIPAEGITFEGPMMHRDVIRKCGLPEKKFFIYGDDTEYFIRAFKKGFDIAIVRDARLNRKLQAPDTNTEYGWKLYYIVRNIIAIDILHGSLPVRLIRPFGYLFRWLKRVATQEEKKTVRKAFLDGYFYKSDN